MVFARTGVSANRRDGEVRPPRSKPRSRRAHQHWSETDVIVEAIGGPSVATSATCSFARATDTSLQILIIDGLSPPRPHVATIYRGACLQHRGRAATLAAPKELQVQMEPERFVQVHHS